jgi:hypothetical protein
MKHEQIEGIKHDGRCLAETVEKVEWRLAVFIERHDFAVHTVPLASLAIAFTTPRMRRVKSFWLGDQSWALQPDLWPIAWKSSSFRLEVDTSGNIEQSRAIKATCTELCRLLASMRPRKSLPIPRCRDQGVWNRTEHERPQPKNASPFFLLQAPAISPAA